MITPETGRAQRRGSSIDDFVRSGGRTVVQGTVVEEGFEMTAPIREPRGVMRAAENIRMCIDRFVPDDRRSDAEADAVESRPDNQRFEPLDGGPQPTRMAMIVSALWPNGQLLKVRFLDGKPEVKKKVEERAHEWSDFANVSFAFDDDPAAAIRVSFEQEGSWSYIGQVANHIPENEPTMNFGWLTPDSADDEYSRVVLHEFGHALGCIHEHQSPDVQIPWDKEAVYAYYARMGWSREQVDRNLFEAYRPEGLRFSRFDRGSIMLYAVDNALTIGDWEVGWNRQLSDGDKGFIAAQYPSEDKQIVDLTVGGAPAKAAIGVHGEIDIFRFRVDQARRHVMKTEGKTDVVMSLAGPNSETSVMALDNDSGKGTNARIVRRLEPATYYLKVQHYHPTGTGDYEVSVRAV
jgi:Astacin (Peptidase family M12A)